MKTKEQNGRRHPREWRRFHRRKLIMLFALLFAAFAAPAAAQTTGANLDANYVLGPGDKVRVIVYGEEDLTGEFEVSGSGMIAYPLVGQIQAAGETLNQLEQTIRTELLEGYLKNPSVSAEVLNYRPFFIEGEVNEPGQYPYVNGMTVREAVAIAGGFTYRAREGTALLIRRTDPKQATNKVPINTPVLPGDYIKIEERFF